MSRRLTIAGAALVAAGLLALPPAVASAHTDDAFVLVAGIEPTPLDGIFPYTPTEIGFSAVSREDGSLAPLPQDTETSLGEAGLFLSGIEIVDEQGYGTAAVSIFGQVLGGTGYFEWDHETGAVDVDSLATPTLDPAFLEGTPFEEDEVALLALVELDEAPGGLLYTAIAIRVEWNEEDYDDYFLIATLDPATGVVAPVEGISPDILEYAYLGPFSVGGLATDPTTGTTWLIMNLLPDDGPFDVIPVAAPVDVSGAGLEATALEAAAGRYDTETGIFTPADSVGAAVVELDDLEVIEGIGELYGDYDFNYVLGADFDEEGELWFTVFSGDESQEQTLPADNFAALVSAAAPFAPDAELTEVGALELADVGTRGWFPGLMAPAPLLALDPAAAEEGEEEEGEQPAEEEEDEELAPTGIDGLAPAGAAAVALLGGTLLLLGRRRQQASN